MAKTFSARFGCRVREIYGQTEGTGIGVPDPVYGESVRAFVVPMPGKSLAARAVIDHVKSKTAPFKAPQKVTFVEALPKSPVGKILKRELRELALKDSGLGSVS